MQQVDTPRPGSTHTPTAVSSGSYAPRRPEETVLYETLQHSLETFFAGLAAADRHLPRFVERELRGFLECGIHAHGFVRVRCPDCRKDRALAFSCKRRGFCPSCGGRRMADIAAHWMDFVLPDIPMRQWVLTLPFQLRYLLAYDADLVTDVLNAFLRTLFAWQRRRAKRSGIDARSCDIRTGAVTGIQRFGSALNLNVHFHTIAFGCRSAMADPACHAAARAGGFRRRLGSMSNGVESVGRMALQA